MSNREMDNELQEETLFKVIHSLGPFNPKNGNSVALQRNEKPLTPLFGSLTHTIGGRGSSEPLRHDPVASSPSERFHRVQNGLHADGIHSSLLALNYFYVLTQRSPNVRIGWSK